MIVEKKAHFYAAHRNQDLDDKCKNLHGHSYFLTLIFDIPKVGSITILFGDLDTVINGVVKGKYDHALLIDRNDPLFTTLQAHHPDFKLVVFDQPTSVENLCFQLFGDLLGQIPYLKEIVVQETTTSFIRYSLADYVKEKHPK